MIPPIDQFQCGMCGLGVVTDDSSLSQRPWLLSLTLYQQGLTWKFIGKKKENLRPRLDLLNQESECSQGCGDL